MKYVLLLGSPKALLHPVCILLPLSNLNKKKSDWIKYALKIEYHILIGYAIKLYARKIQL